MPTPQFQKLTAPTRGEAITIQNGKLKVPDQPIVPISRVTAPGRISGAPPGGVRCRGEEGLWRQTQDRLVRGLCGRKVFQQVQRLAARRHAHGASQHYLVSIKGPLTTPIGGGIRSLNVALRQMLDLYVCLRPVRWFKGVPSPGEASGKSRHGRFSARTPRTSTRASNSRPARTARRKCSPSCKETFPKEFAQNPFPRALRHRHQAGLQRRHGAPDSLGDRVRDHEQAQVA